MQTATAASSTVLFAVTGLDPVLQVFAWMAGTATVGVLALMVLTCAAVLAFFRRIRADTRPRQTLIVPGLGLLGLLTFLALTAASFPTLIGWLPPLPECYRWRSARGATADRYRSSTTCRDDRM